MIRAALFDLDGTILDRLSSLRVYLYQQADRVSYVVGRVPFSDYMNRVIELDANGHSDKQEVYSRIERDFTLPPGSSQQLLDDHLTHFPHVCVPFPKAHQTLSLLHRRGLKLGMVTNGGVGSQWPKIDGLGIAGYFGTILVSES